MQELGWKRSDIVLGTKLMFGGPGVRHMPVGLDFYGISCGTPVQLQTHA